MTHSRRPHAAGRPARIAALGATAALVAALAVTATAAGASSSAKTAQAKKLLLARSDLPQGWTKQKGSNGSGSGNFPGAKKLAACIGVPASLIEANPPTANSPTYQNKGDTLEVDDSVSVFSSVKEAKAQGSAFGSVKTPSCMANLMNGAAFRKAVLSGAGKGAKLGSITATSLNQADFPAGSAGLVLHIPIKVEGVALNIGITIVTFVKGTLGQQVQFTSYGAAFPPSLASSLTAVVEQRL